MIKQDTNWEKITANNMSDKEFVSRRYKQFFEFRNKEENNSNLKMGKKSE